MDLEKLLADNFILDQSSEYVLMKRSCDLTCLYPKELVKFIEFVFEEHAKFWAGRVDLSK